MTALDELLARITAVLDDCDARHLPPLTSGTAAAVLDLAEQTGPPLNPWQQNVVRVIYADAELRHTEPPPAAAPTPPNRWRRILRRPR